MKQRGGEKVREIEDKVRYQLQVYTVNFSLHDNNLCNREYISYKGCFADPITKKNKEVIGIEDKKNKETCKRTL